MIILTTKAINQDYKLNEIESFRTDKCLAFIDRNENFVIQFWDKEISPEIHEIKETCNTLYELVKILNLCDPSEITDVATIHNTIKMCVEYIKDDDK